MDKRSKDLKETKDFLDCILKLIISYREVLSLKELEIVLRKERKVKNRGK